MGRILNIEMQNHIGEEVLLKGWLRLRRDYGKLIFLDIRDSSGLIQAVVNSKVSEDAHKIAKDLRPEDVIEIVGKVNKRPDNAVNKDLKTGTVEIEVHSIKILSKAETLPFDMGGEDLELELPTLLDNRSLTLRHPKVADIFKVQEQISKAFREIAEKLGCTEIFVPTIVASATEGGAEVFNVDYYGHKAYLSQSPQLYKQMLVPVFERVYTIAHAYRAEPSVTTRHLSESTQMDCEFAFADFDELLDLLENVGTHILQTINKVCSNELKKYKVEPISLAKIPRLTLREAQKIIMEETGRDVTKEPDLGPQDEIDICKWALKVHKSDLVTITHFPTSKRSFYTMPDPKDPEYSLSYDLLFRGLEIMSGSQRINNYEDLVSAIKKRGMNPENFEMYLQAFKYGMPPEGGFSFGLERLTMKVLGLSNVREASLFPRDMERVDERFSKLKEK